MKTRSVALALALTFVPAALGGHARAAKPAKNAFQTDVIAALDDAEKKILALEGAVPQDKFAWRPAPGVRSIAEVYLHLAYGNYLFIKIGTGTAPPADSGFDMPKWEARTSNKAEIKAIIEKSFDFARAAVKAVPDAALDKQVDFFGNKITERAAMMAMINHEHEHLGQSIAYARMNNVTPPWSKA